MPTIPRAHAAAWLTLLATPIPLAAHAQPSAALPTGDDGAFRGRMLDWTAPPAVGEGNDETASLGIFPRALGQPLRVVPKISSGFGMRLDPLGLGLRIHTGIDFPGSMGSSVLASGAGIVARAGWSGGYGYMVEIDHGGGLRTRYGHLERMLVTPGEAVTAGEVVGLMGSTGHSTGPHLHYEIRLSGRAVNPLAVRYARGGVATAYAPYIPPLIDVVPHWTGWDATATSESLPSASLP